MLDQTVMAFGRVALAAQLAWVTAGVTSGSGDRLGTLRRQKADVS